jgi:DNA repair protein RecO (recombination protein O)
LPARRIALKAKAVMISKDKGFLVRRHNFRETSLIVNFYTLNFGKISGIMKGFYTGKKEFSSPLTVCSLNELIFYPKRSEIWLISHVDLINDYPCLRNNISHARVAQLFLNLIDKAMQHWDTNEYVFNLLKYCLDMLESRDDLKALYIFIIKFLTYSGFKPEFDHCIDCQDKLKQESFFSISKGGFLCPRCRVKAHDVRAISKEASRSLVYIQGADFALAGRLKLSLACEEEILLILKEFVAYHFGFDILGCITHYRNTKAFSLRDRSTSNGARKIKVIQPN